MKQCRRSDAYRGIPVCCLLVCLDRAFYGAQASLKFAIFLPQPLESCDHRRVCATVPGLWLSSSPWVWGIRHVQWFEQESVNLLDMFLEKDSGFFHLTWEYDSKHTDINPFSNLFQILLGLEARREKVPRSEKIPIPSSHKHTHRWNTDFEDGNEVAQDSWWTGLSGKH